jgi:hypothetical protein
MQALACWRILVRATTEVQVASESATNHILALAGPIDSNSAAVTVDAAMAICQRTCALCKLWDAALHLSM